MSLLGELWGGGTKSEKPQGLTVSAEGGLTKQGETFVEAISSSSEEIGSSKGEKRKMQIKVKTITSAKRPRSPREQPCGRCF